MMEARNKYRARSIVSLTIKHVLLIAIGFIWMYPFLWTISSSFKTNNDFWANRISLVPHEFTFDNFVRVWTRGNFNVYFLNTIVVTLCTVFLVFVMTYLAGYVMGRYNFVGKKAVTGLFLASISIPLVSTIIPTYEILRGMGLIGSRFGLIISGAGGAHVIFLLLFSGFYQQVPGELEDSAKIDGCGFGRTFLSIMMPLGKPVATTCIIMETIWTWNAFMLPLVLTLNNPSARTLAVGLYAFRGENVVDWTGIAAGGTIATLPIILVFIVFQRYFVDGIAGAVKQ